MRLLFQYVLKLGSALDHLFGVRADGIDLQPVLTSVLDRSLDQILTDALAAQLLVDLGMIDRHRAVVLDVTELSYPLAVLVDIERTLPPMFVSLYLHHSSITANEGLLFHHFVRPGC